ncbi:fimbria/pilus periplasmic chaperone [Telmatobacter sp. DSM 110680]|uniref:Fimbria/pilus periplasmic chaperone n=1 Tax=Telmatobacter sp. DSM 110680 TaxID=3036704 RepID=A0AAU7DQB4_9BACT
MILCHRIAVAEALAAILVLATSLAAGAQVLSVQPVNIFLAPGQSATTLTVTNQGASKTAVQIRAYAWSQHGDDDKLAASEQVVVSPPIAMIDPGSSQVVRLILRLPPLGNDPEATYRILVDQIPPPAEPGIVHVVLRLSIPIFALPPTRTFPNVQFHVEVNAGQIYLTGMNTGLRHESIREIELSTQDGRKFKSAPGLSPYILAGVTRRWNIIAQGSLPQPGEILHLTAQGIAGAIEEQVRVVSKQ